ncbi:nucleopolyhedrovirus P10 family protein [Streptomyces sp. NPDC091377]|uniref:nucleopolyhedrovirus P10 family protein n=1 Tax=Streptomyces sp. NPDC091377 TaxID=3365995 RepID=UPI0038011118
MTADQWTRAVRRQLGLGRLLPLGGARDGAWITEHAAAALVRRAADEVPGVRIGPLRIGPAPTTPHDADTSGRSDGEPAVPPPPSALPPGPLLLTADFTARATAGPLPATAARLREALARIATGRLGLTVTDVDLRVTALEEDSPEPARSPGSVRPSERPPGGGVPPSGSRGAGTAGADPEEPGSEEDRVAAAALAVPGVTRLTGALGGVGRAVHIERREDDGAGAVPRRHVRVEVAVDADRRTVEVAREVRAAVGTALSDRPSVAVLVTAVD